MAGSLDHWHHSAAASRARLRTLRKALVRIKNLCMSRSWSAWICMVGEPRDARLRLEQELAPDSLFSDWSPETTVTRAVALKEQLVTQIDKLQQQRHDSLSCPTDGRPSSPDIEGRPSSSERHLGVPPWSQILQIWDPEGRPKRGKRHVP